jgi:signal transduction histidine kinase
LGASSILAMSSEIRSAFGTHDPATIHDTAGEMWTQAHAGHSDAQSAAFVVVDPLGVVVAAVGGTTPSPLQVGRQAPGDFVAFAQRTEPDKKIAFAMWDDAVWQVVVSPVYVDAGPRRALLDVLLAAHRVTPETLRELKGEAGGADFLLRAGGRTLLATTDEVAEDRAAVQRLPLNDADGHFLAELLALRSFAPVEERVARLRRTLLVGWLAAMTIGLALSYLLARRIVQPIRELTDAAVRVSKEDYSVRVPEESHDELGVLARSFNGMAASIEESRAAQVRSGQIAAVGRLAASIAHDLRNPLSAVVGGAEMIAEFDLPPDQIKQTSAQVYKAARRMEQLLSEIGQVARAEPGKRVRCEAAELVRAAVESQEEKARARGVVVREDVESGLALNCEKSRVERVLVNLIANSLDVLADGGEVRVSGRRHSGAVEIEVSDTGPGIPEEIRAKLFQPFVTKGKKNGLGLGLALARQTLLDHGGALELLDSGKGARFLVRLPAGDEGS